jgi:serine protease Do
MEEKQSSYSVAKAIVISSVVTVAIIAGLVFILRGYLIKYISTHLVTQQGEMKGVLANQSSYDDTLVNMISRVNGAVVSVVVTKDVPVYEQYYDKFDPWGFFNIPKVRENGTKEQEVGGGSGFIVSNDGMIVTNNHVVSDEAARYSIVLNTGTVYTVDVLARDPQLDIAVLKINKPIQDSLTFVQFGDSSTLKLGQTVVAIGNALAEFQNSVSVGVVSGLSRTIIASDEFGKSEQLNQVIQTDAAINPGNSGGPLLNLQGEVVGVNVATSRGAENIGFALPAQVVKQTVDSVRQYGQIVRPFIGVRYTMVNQRLVKNNALKVDYGALVLRGQNNDELAVIPGSPADKAGIVENDIILSIDGEELRNKDLSTILRTKAVDQEISLKVLSKGEEKVVTLKLEKTPVSK